MTVKTSFTGRVLASYEIFGKRFRYEFAGFTSYVERQAIRSVEFIWHANHRYGYEKDDIVLFSSIMVLMPDEQQKSAKPFELRIE